MTLVSQDIDFNQYDVIVVGSGLTGSVIARELADQKRILLVEKRNHIGGNVFDFRNDDGILVQKYGPHAFHTNSEEVYKYICKYTNTFEYITKLNVFMKGKFTPSPFNFKTIDQFFPDSATFIKEELLKEYPGQQSVTIVELLKNKKKIIHEYAGFLYQSDYSLYTAKQWGIKPSEVDPSVLKRVPVLLNYDEQYFYDKYQFMPKDGFTSFVENLLNHKNIDVVLNFDFLGSFILDYEKLCFQGPCDLRDKIIVYTGPIDVLFQYKYGRLPYRSLKFDFKTLDCPSFQDVATVAYPEAEGYTRITEYTKMPYQKFDKTVIAYEYPEALNTKNEPYYPILTKESKMTFSKYRLMADKISNTFVCGRLGDFSYYNMDQAIERALDVVRQVGRKQW